MLEYFKNQIVQTFLQWHHQSPLLALPTLNPTPQRKPLPIISVLRAPGGFFPTLDGMFLPPFLDLLTTDTVYWLPTTKYRDLYSYHMQCPFLFTSQLLHWVLKWHSSFKIIHANQYVLFLLYQVIFLPSCSTQKNTWASIFLSTPLSPFPHSTCSTFPQLHLYHYPDRYHLHCSVQPWVCLALCCEHHKGLQGPDWPCLWVNMSWCHSREINEDHSELQSVQLKDIHAFSKTKIYILKLVCSGRLLKMTGS